MNHTKFVAFNDLEKLKAWHSVCPNSSQFQKMVDWCDQQESKGHYYFASRDYWRFEIAEDAVLFLLMWGGSNG